MQKIGLFTSWVLQKSLKPNSIEPLHLHSKQRNILTPTPQAIPYITQTYIFVNNTVHWVAPRT